MSSQPKLIFISKLILVISFFLPSVSASAAGNLKLANTVPIENKSYISFSLGQNDSKGNGVVLDKVCVNNELVKINTVQYDKYTTLPQIENVYYGSIINPKAGEYMLKYPNGESCSTSQSKELILQVKDAHYYTIGWIKNNTSGFDLSVIDDKFKEDISISIINKGFMYGKNDQAIASCIDNKLVSTLSNSSKTASLTTSDDPALPKITIGEHIISTYESGRCTDNSTTINIKPNTIYIYEALAMDVTSVSSNSSVGNIDKIVAPKTVLETVRTGGSNLQFGYLVLVLIALVELRKIIKD
jgi:hypothetical protein